MVSNFIHLCSFCFILRYIYITVDYARLNTVLILECNIGGVFTLCWSLCWCLHGRWEYQRRFQDSIGYLHSQRACECRSCLRLPLHFLLVVSSQIFSLLTLNE
jgi:hypothetical protein